MIMVNFGIEVFSLHSDAQNFGIEVFFLHSDAQ